MSLFSPTVEPPQIKHAFTDETMQPGPSVFLKCIATGNPSPEISWELDSKKIANSERLVKKQLFCVLSSNLLNLTLNQLVKQCKI